MTINEWTLLYYQAIGWTPDPALLKAAALDGFNRESKAARDRVWGLKKLRGADTDASLGKQIAEIEDTLNKANDQAKSAASDVEVTKASKMLEAIEAKAQAAEAAAKVLEAEFDKELQAMPKYLATLETARQERDTITGLPGATKELAEMDLLLAGGQAQITKDGSVSSGYINGLEKLAKHGEILQRARTTSQDFLKKEVPPEVNDALLSAQTKLVAYRQVGPEFQAKLYEKELADAAASGRQDADKAVASLRQTASLIEDDVRAQRELRATAQQDFSAVGELFDSAAKSGVPEANLALAIEKKSQAEQLLGDSEREYQRAAELLKECKSICDSVLTAYESGGKAWGAKVKKLAEIKTKCGQWKQWTSLTARAQSLLDDALELESDVAKSRDYSEGANRRDALEKRASEMDANAKASGMPEDLKDIKKFVEDSKKAGAEVKKAYQEVDAALAELAEKMEGVKNPRSTEYHGRLDKCYNAWIDFIGVPNAGTVKGLEKQKKTTLDEFRKIQADIKNVLKKPRELQKLIDQAKEAEGKQEDSERPQRIKNLLGDLKKFKVDVSAEQAEADKIAEEQLDPGWGRVKKLEEKLAEKLAKAKQQQEVKQKKAAETVRGIQKALKAFESNDRDFKPYIEQLKTQAGDLQSFVDSGDPYLFELAVTASDDLVKRMEAIDPNRRPKDAKTFEQVEEKWTEMSNELGKGNLVAERLPDSYADLRNQLTTAIAEAKESDPDSALKAMEPLAKRIQEARAKAEKEDFNFKAFEEYKKLVEARWKEITKLTKTWITDRTKSYEAKFYNRLAEATALAGKEGKINEAIQKLGEIKDDLEKIASAPDPRQALQEQDVAADREQKQIVDMARQFEAALEGYKKTTLPNLRKALKGVKGADADQLDSLEKVPKQASIAVEPYLNIISKLPHKSLAANSAPPLDKAKQDFTIAQKMLADATRTAKWLAENPGGTNVKFTGDLQRVGQDWVKYANGYTVAVKSLAKTINEAVEAEDDQDLKSKSKKVASLLQGEAPKFFGAQAFAKPLAVLVDQEAAANDAKIRNAQLAAREKALRTVRRYKKQILSDPVLVKINDRDNPFQPLSRKAGVLRATLKRLELELLGSV